MLLVLIFKHTLTSIQSRLKPTLQFIYPKIIHRLHLINFKFEKIGKNQAQTENFGMFAYKNDPSYAIHYQSYFYLKKRPEVIINNGFLSYCTQLKNKNVKSKIKILLSVNSN